MIVPMSMLEPFCDFLETQMGAHVIRREIKKGSVELGRAIMGETFLQLRSMMDDSADPAAGSFEIVCGDPHMKKEIVDNWMSILAQAAQENSNGNDDPSSD